MPSLDSFDEEFGREDSDIAPDPRPKTGFRLSTVIILALAAGVISALALGWPNSSGAPRSDAQLDISALLQPGEKPDAAVRRLAREVEALKKENEDLAQEQQAAETIASLKASERSETFVTWYSDPAALMFSAPMPRNEATAAAPAPPRRSATARPKPRETPRIVDGVPVSIDPPQIEPQ